MESKRKYKILVVDEDKICITSLVQILMPTYTALVATSGMLALRLALDSSPDLILLDMVMPDMSGFEVLAELNKSEATRNIPVICVTGLDSENDKENAIGLGAADYIIKPYKNSDVLQRVKTYLPS